MIEQLAERLEEAGVKAEKGTATSLVVGAQCEAIGDLSIQASQGEYRVEIGPHFHKHFDEDDPTRRLDRVFDFVLAVLADQVVFTVQYKGSAPVSIRMDDIEAGESSFASYFRGKLGLWERFGSLFNGRRESYQSFRWSGPIQSFVPPERENGKGTEQVVEALSRLSASEAVELVEQLKKEWVSDDREDGSS